MTSDALPAIFTEAVCTALILSISPEPGPFQDALSRNVSRRGRGVHWFPRGQG